jgi:hypothetical protein
MAIGHKTGGRQKGSLNKLSADIKDMILGALQDVGGRDYLAARALDQPVAFMSLLGRVLPHQLTGESGAPIAIDLRWADATESVAPPTIEPDPIDNTDIVVEFAGSTC